MTKTHYVCLGECHADISEDRFKGGLVVCGNATCSRKGKPFHKCDKADTLHVH